MRLSPYTSTGPRDLDGVGRSVGVDDDDDANHANAASATTIVSTTSPRFIENTLTVPDDDPAAAEDLKPTVSCPFVPALGTLRLLRLLETPDREGEHRDAQREHYEHFGPDRDDPAVDRQRRGVVLAQHHPADRVDAVRRGIQAGYHRQPRRKPRQREDRAGQEQHRGHDQPPHHLEALQAMHAGGDPEPRRRPGPRKWAQHRDHLDDLERVEVDADDGRRDQEDQALTRRDRSAAGRLAEHEPGAADRRHEHLAEESELAVPHDRDRREQAAEQDGHRHDAGKDELLVVDAAGAVLPDERFDPRAEHEEEQDRLRQAGHDPGRRAAEADDLALPHHADGAQVADERALGRRRRGVTDVGNAGAGQRLRCGRHQPRLKPRTIGFALSWSPAPASASRMSRPVYWMKTSSRLGRRTFTLRTPTVRCSNMRGTNHSPSGTRNRSPAPLSSTSPSTPSPRAISSRAVASSAVSIVTVSTPTDAFSASGESMATMRPRSMIAMRSQRSASSM